MLTPRDVSILACPECHCSLTFNGRRPDPHLRDGALRCDGCAASWPVRDGIASLYRERRVGKKDRVMRALYDTFAGAYDPFVSAAFALMDTISAGDAREFYLRRLDLEGLRPHESGRPARILEVGIGTGTDLPIIRRRCLPGAAVEIWGIDLSRQMLRILQRKLAGPDHRETRFVAADAHALPFRDGTFDRVIQVGAVNACRDPQAVLREMARVAAPRSPIVVVDEQLDRSSRHRLAHRAFFRMLTFYDERPHCPVELLPAGARRVSVEQMSRYFYCLTFQTS